MYILGLNCAYHESAACLIKNGKIIAAVEEERFNRIKHAKPARVDNPDELPIHAINYCLKTAGIKLKDIDHIGFSFNPKKRLKNIGADKYFIKGDWGSKEGEELFYKRIKTIPEKLNQLVGQDISEKFHWIDHHLCHAASAFFVSPFKEAAILSVDGIGEFTTTWLGYGNNNKIKALREIEYPNSLGFLWEKFSKFLGLGEYDAFKVMGLSAYGNPITFEKAFDKIIKMTTGNFEIDNKIVQFRSADFTTLENLFGKRRKPEEKISSRHADIAAGLQRVTERILFSLANWAIEKTGTKKLCLAGGVVLNCVANEKLFVDLGYQDVFVQPAAHDAGTALGAAYWIWNQLLDNKRSFVLKHVFFGPDYSNQEIETVLKTSNLKWSKQKNIEKVVARFLSQGKIIGWFQGKLEFGPRALGHRSILVDPRDRKFIDILNLKIKEREWFRPFAPSILAKKEKEFYIVKRRLLADRFMLFALKARPEKAKLIPAVVHADGTSRVHFVEKITNPRYYKLLEEFEKITGVPLFLNTSFNRQEPIVCSPEDAINTFKKADLDYLAIGDYLVKKR